jgi:DNA-directed RNA polymerase specialized sigma24 family protein
MGATEQRGRSQGDEALVTAVARGDSRASSGLYDRLADVVDDTLFRVFGRREPDHDDLVQATFERIVAALSRHAFARACNLSSLACRIATRVGLDALRARRPDVDRVRRDLASMSPENAEAVLLHDLCGYELAEIAQLTGASASDVQSRLARGRRELQSKGAEPRVAGRVPAAAVIGDMSRGLANAYPHHR